MMKLKPVSLIFALGISWIGLTSAAARADNFTFSFANDPASGNVAGIVTGTIFGLTDNSTGPATDVVITGYPAGLDSVYPAGSIDVISWLGPNSFTESGGAITSATLQLINFNAPCAAYACSLFINYQNGEDNNQLSLDGQEDLYVADVNGVTFTPLASPVPEPGTIVSTLSGLAWLMRKRRTPALR